MFIAEKYSDSLPCPDLMNRYGDETQKTVLALALDEQRRLMRRQLLGFIFAMACLLSGVFLILNDKDVAGSGALLLAVLRRFSGRWARFSATLSAAEVGKSVAEMTAGFWRWFCAEGAPTHRREVSHGRVQLAVTALIAPVSLVLVDPRATVARHPAVCGGGSAGGKQR